MRRRCYLSFKNLASIDKKSEKTCSFSQPITSFEIKIRVTKKTTGQLYDVIIINLFCSMFVNEVWPSIVRTYSENRIQLTWQRVEEIWYAGKKWLVLFKRFVHFILTYLSFEEVVLLITCFRLFSIMLCHMIIKKVMPSQLWYNYDGVQIKLTYFELGY